MTPTTRASTLEVDVRRAADAAAARGDVDALRWHEEENSSGAEVLSDSDYARVLL